MGNLCIIGVDDHVVLKDFIRAHVDFLEGGKVCVGGGYPDYNHEGRTIRVYYSDRKLVRKLGVMLPQFLHRRWVGVHERSEERVREALADFFRRQRVDVVLAEFGTAGAEVCGHCEALGVPLIVHFHGHDVHREAVVGPLAGRYREMFRSAFRLVSVSRMMSERLVAMGADPAKVVTNPYGPRDTYFDLSPDYRPVLLALGRFTDIKAPYLTLMAFRKVLDSEPGARLVMAGDGELLETCRTLAEVWGMGDRVEFPGAVPHAGNRQLFERACGFVQHSVTPSYGDAEGTPVVVLEAQAAGLPVVATRHAGLAEAVVDGVTGYLVAERDVDGMAERMLRLVRDLGMCRRMGAAARDHIRERYGMERHIRCLQRLIDEARAGGVVGAGERGARR